MQGVPVRIELGPRDMEKGEFVAVRRDTSAKMILKIDTAVDSVTQLLDDIHDNMYRKYVITVTLLYSLFNVILW